MLTYVTSAAKGFLKAPLLPYNFDVISKIKLHHLDLLKKSSSTIYTLIFLISNWLMSVLYFLWLHPFVYGWLCWKEFKKTVIRSTSYRIELRLLSGQPQLFVDVCKHKIKEVNLVSFFSDVHCSCRHLHLACSCLYTT